MQKVSAKKLKVGDVWSVPGEPDHTFEVISFTEKRKYIKYRNKSKEIHRATTADLITPIYIISSAFSCQECNNTFSEADYLCEECRNAI